MNKKTTLSILVLLASLAGGSQASTTALPDPVVSERLKCLKRPDKPTFPAHHAFDSRQGFMRFKLSFEAGSRKPKVEVLHAVAASDMQKVALDYVEDFRLPCLQEGDPPVTAVQEIHFSGHADPEPLALHDEVVRAGCIVMPDEPPSLNSFRSARGGHVIARGRFDGSATAKPAISFVYSTGDKRMEETVREYLSRYRMPCRSAADRPFEFEQAFALRIPGDRSFVLTRTDFSLPEFLGLAKDPEQLQADFDLNSMACPFKLSVALRQPRMPNQVQELGSSNPNRVALLHWLSELQFAWKTEQQAQDLFNSHVTVTIPCGVVKLNPPPSPQGVSS